jgi:hypothetical protein
LIDNAANLKLREFKNPVEPAHITMQERSIDPGTIRTRRRLLLAVAAYMAIAHIALDGGFLFWRFLSLGVRGDELVSWSEYLEKRLGFVAIHLIAITSLICLSLSRQRVLSVVGLAVMFIATMFDLSYFFAAKRFPNFSDVAALVDAVGQAPEAIQEYRVPILSAFAITAIAFVPLIAFSVWQWPAKRSRGLGRFALVSIGGLFIIYCALAGTKGEAGLAGFPRGYSSLFASALVAVNDPKLRDTHFEYLTPYNPSTPRMTKIVVVMDESVAESAFRAQQNGHRLPNTYVYPGPVYSGANSSAPSNYYFRKAVRLPTGGISQVASLFEQAKKVGYRTVYIDNQGVLNDHGARNYMDVTEVGFISEIISNDGLPRHERDAVSLRQLEKILQGKEATFVYINKLGSHFPYSTTIAPELRSGNRTDDYLRSVRVNAVEYLARLMAMVGPDSVVIYTSDHGQDFEHGLTHGDSGDDASVNQWKVPFAVGSGSAQLMHRVTTSPTLASQYLSHFDIAELVRNLIGYSSPGSLQILGEAATGRAAADFCAYYGPPYSGVGPYQSGPRCKVLGTPPVFAAGSGLSSGPSHASLP